MGQTEATRQGDWLTPPRAGQISVYSVTSTTASQDLRLCGQQTPNISSPTQQVPGLPGHYVALQADGGDVYIITGPTAASVTGANAPSSTAAGTNATGGCVKIPSGFTAQFKPSVTLDWFLGYVTSAGNTATIRIFQVGP